MPESIPTGSLQSAALRAYMALAALRRDWQRGLVLLESSAGAASFAFAASAAGAAVLWTADTAASLREASRAGITDFSVSTLSEAVRVLKNEIRKGQPICVGVLDAQKGVWDEIVGRGLQPEALLTAELRQHSASDMLLSRGALNLSTITPGHSTDAQHQRCDTAANWRERRAADEALLTAFAQLPEPRRTLAMRWLQSAPRLFPRDLHRCYVAGWSASSPPV